MVKNANNIYENEEIKDESNETENNEKSSGKTSKAIPEELRKFFNENYLVFIGGCGAPKEFSSLGDGFKGERNITQEDLSSFSRETLLYLSQFKNPDFILKNFKSGSINFYQL